MGRRLRGRLRGPCFPFWKKKKCFFSSQGSGSNVLRPSRVSPVPPRSLPQPPGGDRLGRPPSAPASPVAPGPRRTGLGGSGRCGAAVRGSPRGSWRARAATPGVAEGTALGGTAAILPSGAAPFGGLGGSSPGDRSQLAGTPVEFSLPSFQLAEVVATYWTTLVT